MEIVVRINVMSTRNQEPARHRDNIRCYLERHGTDVTVYQWEDHYLALLKPTLQNWEPPAEFSIRKTRYAAAIERDDEPQDPKRHKPDSPVQPATPTKPASQPANPTKPASPVPPVETAPPSQPTSQASQPGSRPRRPRRHPALQPSHFQPSLFPVTCLLFRPLAGKSLHSADKRAVARELQAVQPQPVELRRIRDGGLAVDFPADQPLDAVRALSSLGGVPVTVSSPQQRQGASGVVRGDFSSAEEVVDLYAIHASNPAISSVTQLGDRQVFRIHFLHQLPTAVRIFHSLYVVEPFFQSPRRCYQCSGFGHLAAACRSKPACSLCSSPDHDHRSCPGVQVRCVNCGGRHPATAKTCPHRLFHLQVAKTAAKQGTSQREARVTVSASYADAVRKRSAPNSSSRPVPIRNSPIQTVPARSSPQPAASIRNPASVPMDSLPAMFAHLFAALFPDRQLDETAVRRLLQEAAEKSLTSPQ